MLKEVLCGFRQEIIGKPIKFLGTSEKIDGLDLFDPARIADRILGYGDVVALVNKGHKPYLMTKVLNVWNKVSNEIPLHWMIIENN